ncbi:putative oxidoreductase [Salmonella enterica subsp. enterica serovar Gallinarum/Pullorum str. FCAV198]|nr:putative oxidoreductase [Salmonella enterica subsp. enterica serovar Gallinarum/Pullorum str. FCAV198]
MNHTEIRVVTGPANYFSHAGSLERLTDFFTPEQLSHAVWVYGEPRLPPPGLTCRKRLNVLAQSICRLPAIVANAMLPNWRTPATTIVRW